MATFTTTFYDQETRQPIPAGADPEDFDIYGVSKCDEDGSLVFTTIVGTSEYASCRKGHCWMRTFGTPDTFVQVR